ncbi:Uncharacterised protein [Mycobacteroides abscessus]|nr:Uncharacterised protein [Mycobacteroides abscessus]
MSGRPGPGRYVRFAPTPTARPRTLHAVGTVPSARDGAAAPAPEGNVRYFGVW